MYEGTMFYIYIIKNLINKKAYIGKTNDVSARYQAHIRDAFSKSGGECVKFYRSLRKYGINNFSQPEILGNYNDEDLAYEAEKQFIASYDTYHKGLNACHGGRGVFGSGKDSVFYLHKESILAKRAAKKNSLEKITERFFSYVEKEKECWIWIGGRCHEYGTFRLRNKQIRAHAASWIIHNELVPDGYLVSHSCGNFLCVNPNHLVLKTREQLNAITNSNSSRRGSNNGCSKLTEEKVRDIRLRYAAGNITLASLAKEYNVASTTISGIVRGLKWKAII